MNVPGWVLYEDPQPADDDETPPADHPEDDHAGRR